MLFMIVVTVAFLFVAAPQLLSNIRGMALSAIFFVNNDYQILWDPKSKKIGCYDIEHQELRELCKFDEFIADMAGQLETLF